MVGKANKETFLKLIMLKMVVSTKRIFCLKDVGKKPSGCLYEEYKVPPALIDQGGIRKKSSQTGLWVGELEQTTQVIHFGSNVS